MSTSFGGHSMVAPLCRVLVRRPNESFAVEDPARWHYTGPIDLETAQQEHDTLVAILRQEGIEILFHDAALPDHADAIYVRDPALMTDEGAVILHMGKALRRGEEAALAACFKRLDIPILHTLSGDALAEGGDLVWLNEHTLAAGQGFRTNAEGIRQLQEALNRLGVTVLPVPLPYYEGVEACLHLMSLISIADHDLAIIYPRLLPVPFWEYLRDHGFQFVEVPDVEFTSMGPNMLTLSPRKCLMLEGNPITRQRLEKVGCEVFTYKGNEISLKAEGGPTCLTRPILRAW